MSEAALAHADLNRVRAAYRRTRYFDERVETIKEVAERLHVSQRTVWRLIRANQLRARRILGATRVSERDLDDFIRNC